MKVWHQIEQGAINADVLILGNSHAHVQVNPSLLTEAFPGKLIYNFGLEGYGFDMQLTRYQFYRRFNKAPQAIIVCADFIEFSRSKWEINRTQFLPYAYDRHIRTALEEIGAGKLRMRIPILKYWGDGNALIAAVTGKTPLSGDNLERRGWSGFEPMAVHWNEKAFVEDTLRRKLVPNIDPEIMQLFLHFHDECIKSGIAVYVVFTPHQRRFTSDLPNAAAYKTQLRKCIAARTPFIDFCYAPFCNDTALFYNGTHLNAKGADVFSALLADSLRKRISTVNP